MKLLVAWSLGAHWGHVSRQLALAERARDAGAEVIWAVPPRQSRAMAMVRARGWRVLVNEAVSVPKAPAAVPRSFADVLVAAGFGYAQTLLPQVQAWWSLYQAFRPDRVLLDYAPAAQLAARIAGLPAVQVTNGFESPPADCPPYASVVDGPYLWRRAAAQHQRVDEVVRAVTRVHAPQLDGGLREMIEYPRRLLTCVPESAPYGDRAAPDSVGMDYVGALGEAPGAEPARWFDTTASPRVLAYLRGHHPHHVKVIDELRKLSATVLCVWPDAPSIGYTDHPRLRITRQPVCVHAALGVADAVLNYGSGGFVTRALLAGKPQLMLPIDQEKQLISEQVARSGAGRVVDRCVPAHEAVRGVQEVLADVTVANAARRVAAKYTNLQSRAPVLIDAALGFVSSPPLLCKIRP